MDRRPARLAVALTALVVLAGAPLSCSPPTVGGADGGNDGGTDAATDAGRTDAGNADGGASDAGPTDAGDAGCTDPSCVPCASGGTLCPGVRVCVAGACLDPCTPGATRCNGLLVETCQVDGATWSPAARCPGDALCRADACVAVSTCASESPACCAVAADCGTLHTYFSCPECRAIVTGGYCTAGTCEPEPTGTADFSLVADATPLSPADRLAINSAVVTIYRGIAGDGHAATCTWLLGPTAPHDSQDPALNATVAHPYDFTFGSGNDVYTMLVQGVPSGTNQTIVITAYSGIRGGGSIIGRACLDAQTIDGSSIVIRLSP